MTESINHSDEVERRIAAIPIGTQDYCNFFCLKDSELINIQECWYCRYAVFAFGDSVEARGFCRFKK